MCNKVRLLMRDYVNNYNDKYDKYDKYNKCIVDYYIQEEINEMYDKNNDLLDELCNNNDLLPKKLIKYIFMSSELYKIFQKILKKRYFYFNLDILEKDKLKIKDIKILTELAVDCHSFQSVEIRKDLKQRIRLFKIKNNNSVSE